MDKNLIIIIGAWILSEVTTIRSLWLLRKRIERIEEDRGQVTISAKEVAEALFKVAKTTPPEPAEMQAPDNHGYTERLRGVDRHYDVAPPKHDYRRKADDGLPDWAVKLNHMVNNSTGKVKEYWLARLQESEKHPRFTSLNEAVKVGGLVSGDTYFSTSALRVFTVPSWILKKAEEFEDIVRQDMQTEITENINKMIEERGKLGLSGKEVADRLSKATKPKNSKKTKSK